jgi:hypothetical protein
MQKGIDPDLIISRAADYADYCKKKDPETYPHSAYIADAQNWIEKEQFNVDWSKRVVKEQPKKKTQPKQWSKPDLVH